jgi:hypothetical protein
MGGCPSVEGRRKGCRAQSRRRCTAPGRSGARLCPIPRSGGSHSEESNASSGISVERSIRYTVRCVSAHVAADWRQSPITRPRLASGRATHRHLRPVSRRAAEDASGTPLGDGARDGAQERGRSPVHAARPKPAGAGARPRAHALAGAVRVEMHTCRLVGTHMPHENGCTGDLSAEDIPDLSPCGAGICEAGLSGLICPMAQHPNWRRTTRSGRAPPAALRPAAGAQPAPDLSANGRAAPSLVRPRAQARMPALACPVGQPLRMS